MFWAFCSSDSTRLNLIPPEGVQNVDVSRFLLLRGKAHVLRASWILRPISLRSRLIRNFQDPDASGKWLELDGMASKYGKVWYLFWRGWKVPKIMGWCLQRGRYPPGKWGNTSPGLMGKFGNSFKSAEWFWRCDRSQEVSCLTWLGWLRSENLKFPLAIQTTHRLLPKFSSTLYFWESAGCFFGLQHNNSLKKKLHVIHNTCTHIYICLYFIYTVYIYTAYYIILLYHSMIIDKHIFVHPIHCMMVKH